MNKREIHGKGSIPGCDYPSVAFGTQLSMSLGAVAFAEDITATVLSGPRQEPPFRLPRGAGFNLCPIAQLLTSKDLKKVIL